MADTPVAHPRRVLSVTDAVAVIVGIVIGAGIFRLPPLVAANVDGTAMFVLVWLAGGGISLIGALCYAELASTYPNTGGDYHFLRRAFGDVPAFLFAWARLTVIQTGSIAVVAFMAGDYATQILSLGNSSSAIYAALVVILFTGLNIAGLKQGRIAQYLLIGALLLGMGLIVVTGGVLAAANSPPSAALAEGVGGGVLGGSAGAIGLAMVFVLYTFGGWNEAAYLSAEMRGNRRSIMWSLVIGIALVTTVYLVINLAFLGGLGLEGIAASEAVAADLMRQQFGDRGAMILSLIICVAAVSTLNATIITGARSAYALGRDFPVFSWLGRWHSGGSTPVNALVLQGMIALGLVVLGGTMGRGFETMVDYTLPVFWFFFGLTGAALIVMRMRDPSTPRGFRVPLYPLTPMIFIAVCMYMLYSGLLYTGRGALVGVAVLLAGVPLLLLARARQASQPAAQTPVPEVTS